MVYGRYIYRLYRFMVCVNLLITWRHTTVYEMHGWDLTLAPIPSGYVKIAIENGH